MRDLFLLAIFLFYMGLGLRAPFVLGLGYIWVDFFNPQKVAFTFLTRLPLSFIMGAAAVLGFVFVARKQSRPRIVPGIWLLVLWAAWVTLTTLWAEVPDAAWEKWDWAFKTICFAAFLPFLFRSRVQLEALLLTLVLSMSAGLLAAAVKTLVTGGGYHLDLGLFRGNSGLVEGSTLSCLAVAVIPIFHYLHRSDLFFKTRWHSFLLFYGLSAASVLTCIGTFERTGLVSLGVLAVLLLPNVKRRMLYVTAMVIVVAVGGYFVSDRWMNRMQTIQGYQSDASAMARVEVWLWTLDYVRSHPLGGGFEAYRINKISVQTGEGNNSIEQTGRAFHSIWFEVLGEQGIPGFVLYISLIVAFYSSAFRTYRRTKHDIGLKWANMLSRTIMMSATIFLVGSSFINGAFQPFFYELLATGIILHELVHRAVGSQPATVQALAPTMPSAI